MKHKISAAILTLLAVAFLWQAFAQTETPCVAECKATFEACKKQAGDDPKRKVNCLFDYDDCLVRCKKVAPDCKAACDAKLDACNKQAGDDPDKKIDCLFDYAVCMKACK